MNLPIKLVDFVTLLFLSLLVVIVVFIILQRNIKRFKLRNVKDPHFLTCKSIPKDLKQAILMKHQKSHIYHPPPHLLTVNHLKNSEDKTKPFLIRMKAFEASKNLEYALCDYGYRRPYSRKLEDFLILLVNHTDENLPKDLLKSYHDYYLWAMLDPMVFDLEHLRKHNFLINSIIERLAFTKKANLTEYNKILQHKLELNALGDIDFKNQENINNNLKKASFYENKFNMDSTDLFNVNSKVDSKACTSTEASSIPIPNQYNKSTSKSSSHKGTKNIFRKQSNSSSLKNEEDQDKVQLIMDTSFDSVDTAKAKSSFTSRKNQASKKDNRLGGDFLDFDENMSEIEKIPLVTSKKSHQKKKSNNSEKIMLDPLLKASSKQLSKVATENEGFNQTFESTT